MNIPAIRRTVIGLLAALLLQGCLDYQETIRIQPDGSVEITVYATVSQQALPMLKNRPELQQLLFLPSDASKVGKVLPPGVQVKHWVVAEGPGIRIYDAAVTIPSIDQLGMELAGLMSTQAIQVFRDEDRTIQYRREIPPQPMANLGIAGKLLRDKLSNSNLEFTLIVPTKIVETNGHQVDERTIHWQTDLVQLRQQGFEMVAKVKQPGLLGMPPMLAAGAGALVVVAAVLLFWRRRRRAKGTPPGPPPA